MEVVFFIQLLGSMKIAIQYLVMARVDNVGAIFMASNKTNTCHTKHVDIKYKYVNENVENRIVKITFKSADNDIDILRKNLSADLHKKHSKKMVVDKQ